MCASGLAAFYSATARSVRWFGDLSNPEFWIKDPLDQPDTWSATAFRALRDAHRQLVEKYHCVDAPSGPVGSESASAAHGSAASPLQLPPLKMLASPDSSDSEDGSDVPSVSVPSQNRVTSQVLTNWGLHQRAHGAPLSERCTALRSLHSKQQFPAVDEDKDNSILQNNIPDGGDGSRTLKWSPAAWLSCLSSPNRHGTVMHFTGAEWQAWFCQYLGVPVPSL